jgi:hypothetical protein
MSKFCIKCSGIATKTCQGCNATYYCSSKCQKDHWLEHKVKCKHIKAVDTSSEVKTGDVRKKTKRLLRAFGLLKAELRNCLWYLLKYANRRAGGVKTPHWVVYVSYSIDISSVNIEDIVPILHCLIFSLVLEHVTHTPKYDEHSKLSPGGEMNGMRVAVVTAKKIIDHSLDKKEPSLWLPDLPLEWKEQPTVVFRSVMKGSSLISPMVLFSPELNWALSELQEEEEREVEAIEEKNKDETEPEGEGEIEAEAEPEGEDEVEDDDPDIEAALNRIQPQSELELD